MQGTTVADEAAVVSVSLDSPAARWQQYEQHPRGGGSENKVVS